MDPSGAHRPRLWFALAGTWVALAPASPLAAPPPPAGAAAPISMPLAWFLPWAQRPEHVHWMFTFGPAVSFFTEPPQGATNVFVGVRLGISLATRGHHHIAPGGDTPIISAVGRHTYFRSGLPFLPDNIFISPLRDGAEPDGNGMDVYGLSIRLVSLGMHPAGRIGRFGFSVGLIGTYAAITTDEHTDFLRPGVDVRADLELDWDGPWFVGVGWNSLFHIPQDWGTSPGGSRPGSPPLWHIGQAYLLFNIRVGDEDIITWP